jgi:hypothetical protein
VSCTANGLCLDGIQHWLSPVSCCIAWSQSAIPSYTWTSEVTDIAVSTKALEALMTDEDIKVSCNESILHRQKSVVGKSTS